MQNCTTARDEYAVRMEPGPGDEAQADRTATNSVITSLAEPYQFFSLGFSFPPRLFLRWFSRFGFKLRANGMGFRNNFDAVTHPPRMTGGKSLDGLGQFDSRGILI